MAKRLFIDLEELRKSKDLQTKCSYFYHPDNDGTLTLRELATYAVICRQCELANCVEACPKEALEKQPDGILKRYNLRCISCKSCSIACPFGTILPELIPFYTAGCDYCIGRKIEVDVPDCVRSGPEKAIDYRDVKEDPENGIYFVGDHLAVRAENFKEKLNRELE
jgi:Fe-S-cluster-containing dehydrogenase component